MSAEGAGAIANKAADDPKEAGVATSAEGAGAIADAAAHDPKAANEPSGVQEGAAQPNGRKAASRSSSCSTPRKDALGVDVALARARQRARAPSSSSSSSRPQSDALDIAVRSAPPLEGDAQVPPSAAGDPEHSKRLLEDAAGDPSSDADLPPSDLDLERELLKLEFSPAAPERRGGGGGAVSSRARTPRKQGKPAAAAPAPPPPAAVSYAQDGWVLLVAEERDKSLGLRFAPARLGFQCVSEVLRGSWAERNGIEIGWILMGIDGESLASLPSGFFSYWLRQRPLRLVFLADPSLAVPGLLRAGEALSPRKPTRERSTPRAPLAVALDAKPARRAVETIELGEFALNSASAKMFREMRGGVEAVRRKGSTFRPCASVPSLSKAKAKAATPRRIGQMGEPWAGREPTTPRAPTERSMARDIARWRSTCGAGEAHRHYQALIGR
eukprot:TRINITY_DN4580_c0_g3_i1.p1 TRINITY_DN4580_c0_g3~~TRINITY_DN4580_c0_g3_i1.p1  ORF type:complete len:493 (-),score=137.70 TRINITY_DN4580_c0_g3_i1:89-1417(-)